MERLVVIDPTAEARVLIELLCAPPDELASTTGPATPGVYAISYVGPHPLYQSISGRTRPLYVGSADQLRSRLADHAATLGACRNLDVADFEVRTIATLTPLDAYVAEQLLQTALLPPWNHPAIAGFGSRRQGARRESAQLATPWDSLHPGRSWAANMPLRDPATIAAAVMAAITKRPRLANLTGDS